MEKGILLAFVLVCHSHQRPTPPDDGVTAAAGTAEPTGNRTAAEMGTGITAAPAAAAAAVSVGAVLNVSGPPLGPGPPVFEGFTPSDYYRHRGQAHGNSGTGQAARETFYGPQAGPGGPAAPATDRPTPKPNGHKAIVFPREPHAATGHVQYGGGGAGPNWPEPRGPYAFAAVSPRYKPAKHDNAESVRPDDNPYDRHFGQQYHGDGVVSGNRYQPDGPPKFSYHGAAVYKKKDPWRSLLSVLATILPVGLLLASFPPTIIKVNSTQYPYQFQKNATSYNPIDVISGRYRALGKQNAADRKANDAVDESSSYLDECLKNKICENMKTNYSPSELDFLLINDRSTWTRDVGQMTEIADTAASPSPESCRVRFVCDDRTVA